LGIFNTVPAHNLDNEATFCLAFSILDGDIAPLDGGIPFSGWVNDSALENGQQCLRSCKQVLM
jgi:hypothetical protein